MCGGGAYHGAGRGTRGGVGLRVGVAFGRACGTFAWRLGTVDLLDAPTVGEGRDPRRSRCTAVDGRSGPSTSAVRRGGERVGPSGHVKGSKVRVGRGPSALSMR